MITVEKIKEKLPDWPDAVVKEWLLYFANDIGWPPAEPFGSEHGLRLWRRFALGSF
jgi:hypothetical protein